MPPLVSALMLERYAMFFILGLIMLVASLSIIALIFMIITHKQYEIAVLRSMGTPYSTLVFTFLLVALGITVPATILGILLATGATWLLQTYPFIQLPDVYYVTHLPAQLNGTIVVSIFLLTILTSLVAALIPSLNIKSLRLARLLKGLL